MPPIGMSAKCGTCSGSFSTVIRILLASSCRRAWVGHPLRKEHPARATEMGPYQLPPDKEVAEQEALRFRPEEWGMSRERDGSDFIFLNIGPQHPGTHGVLRIALQLDGEEIVDAVPKSASTIVERRRWASASRGTRYIPYTDRDRLPGRRDEQPGLSDGGREAGRH